MLVQFLLPVTLTLNRPAGGVCIVWREWQDHFEPQLLSACYAAMQSVIWPLIVPFLGLQQSSTGEVLKKATRPMARWSALMDFKFKSVLIGHTMWRIAVKFCQFQNWPDRNMLWEGSMFRELWYILYWYKLKHFHWAIYLMSGTCSKTAIATATYISAFLGLFIFMACGLQTGSGGGLSDVAPWKGHLAWGVLPDSGPYTGAMDTWQSWQDMHWQFARYGNIPLWFGWADSAWRPSGWKVTKWSKGSSKGSSAGDSYGYHTHPCN